MASKYDGWTMQDFAREYAASIDRMMTKKERTATTFGGETYTYWAGDSKLDLPDSFSQAWRKCEEDERRTR